MRVAAALSADLWWRRDRMLVAARNWRSCSWSTCANHLRLPTRRCDSWRFTVGDSEARLRTASTRTWTKPSPTSDRLEHPRQRDQIHTRSGCGVASRQPQQLAAGDHRLGYRRSGSIRRSYSTCSIDFARERPARNGDTAGSALDLRSSDIGRASGWNGDGESPGVGQGTTLRVVLCVAPADSAM